jgi:hypothetical protein
MKERPTDIGFVEVRGDGGRWRVKDGERVLARSERFELPTLGIEIRCSIQLSYERLNRRNGCSGFEPIRHADQIAFGCLLFKPVRPTQGPFWPIWAAELW